MPKKTTKKKTKKTAKKIIIAQVPQPEAPTAADNIIAVMASLQATEGWAMVVKILNDNISYLEKAIIDKVDPQSNEPLTDKEVELLRIKRSLNIDLRETPKNYAQVAKDTGEVPEDFDPYFKTNDEIIKSRRRPPQDDKGRE